MANVGTFGQGAATLKLIRDRPGYERGLRPGRLARIRLGTGFTVLVVGAVSLVVGMIGISPAGPEAGPASSVALVSTGVVGAIVGVALIVFSLAPASLHRLFRFIQAFSRGASLSAGIVGLAASAAVVAAILYGILAAPGSVSERTLVSLLGILLLCGELALLTIIDLKPILSSDGRSGAKSAMLRMHMCAAIVAGALASAIMLATTNASLGDYLPSALALTAAGATVRWSMVYRRRVDGIQREIAERLTDVVVVSERSDSNALLAEALMRLENTICPASEDGRLAAVMRADSDVRKFVGYLIERVRSRHTSFAADQRFEFLQEIPDEALCHVAGSVADTLRWNLLAPREHKLTAPTTSPTLPTTTV